MWTCKNCDAEVESTFEVCWSCGATRDGVADPGFDQERDGIIGPEEFKTAQEARGREQLIVLGTFWSAPEAHILRSKLEAEGIPAVVEDDLATTTTWGNLSISGGVKLAVPESRAEQARKILDLGKEESRLHSQNDKSISAAPMSNAVTEEEEADEKVKRTSDDMANYAYRSAIVGLPQFLICNSVAFFALWDVLLLFPLIVPGYSIYWLIRVSSSPDELSPSGHRMCLAALIIDVACVGIFLLVLATRIGAWIAE